MTVVVDRVVVNLCAVCLADTAIFESTEEDLALVGVALRRDLADACIEAPVQVLEAAWRRAVEQLDASDISAPEFADALSRLATLRAAWKPASGATRPAALSPRSAIREH